MASKRPLARKVRGYPRFAGQIGLRPNLSIFRRFGALNAENLLYLQAELVLLEKALEDQQHIDSTSNNLRRSKYSLNWYQLRNSAQNGDTAQLDLVYRIRKTLKQYNDAMIQQAHILTYQKPSPKDLKYIQNFLHTELGLSLCGPDATIWGSVSARQEYNHDVINLHPKIDKDMFSNWAIDKTITYLFRCGCARFMKESPVHGVIGYEDMQVISVTYWVTSIIASLLLISSIVILYMVHSMSARLGIIAGFNALMTICLILFTNAKRSEMFAITATFAAVQVVFISSDK